MIIRIVKMTFDPAKTQDFLEIFNESKQLIRNMKGCRRLELLRDVNDNHVFFTYSFWEKEEDLQNYRQSSVFKDVWARTKVLFIAKAEAWSLNQQVMLD